VRIGINHETGETLPAGRDAGYLNIRFKNKGTLRVNLKVGEHYAFSPGLAELVHFGALYEHQVCVNSGREGCVEVQGNPLG
jgi:hypothetical protein